MNDETRRLARLDRRHLWHPFTQMRDWEREEPVIIRSARGCRLTDTEGRTYLDGVSSLWVNVHGHRRPEIDRAVRRQLGRVAHSTLLGLGNVPSIELAAELVRIAPPGLTRVFYSDNGSTAVEVALKLAFSYWRRGGEGRKRLFVRLRNAYHGDTIGAVSVGGIDLFHERFRPLLFPTLLGPSFDCYRCPLGRERSTCSRECLAALARLVRRRRDEIAALVIEPLVQAAGGMIVARPGHLAAVASICRENGVLLIADEVAVGFGRTGTMFACEREGVSPDLLALSKGISGGYLPLGATLATDRIYRAFRAPHRARRTFFHGHSYTGNPLACAAALASLEVFRRERVLDRLGPKIRLLGRLLAPLARRPHVGDVRQCGLMAGIELVRSKRTKRPYPFGARVGHRVSMRARRHGLVIRPLGDVIVLMPPLSVSPRDLRRMVAVVGRCIREETE
ncbi:MAG: adenosylmethionine--8-amino-7-oxononanoate transaminase [bacterium]|nr:adenosylmethionine--8-amino-7-oxononanoate transaminase [bacterium]